MPEDVIELVAGHVPQFDTVHDSSLGLAGVYLLDGNVESVGDVLHGLIAFTDDTDGLGDGLGSDGMVTSNHDNLDTGRSALGNGVGDSSSGGIDQGDEANEAEGVHGEVAVVRVEWEADGVLVSRQAVVTETKHTLAETCEVKQEFNTQRKRLEIKTCDKIYYKLSDISTMFIEEVGQIN